MKKLIVVFFLFFSIAFVAQTERFPIFEKCNTKDVIDIELCFYQQTKKIFFRNFNQSLNFKKENYNTDIKVVFVVSNKGDFKLIYANSPNEALQKEIEKVFSTFPTIIPAKYNNHNVEMRFVLPLNFTGEKGKIEENSITIKTTELLKRREGFKSFTEHKSQLNIPFNHSTYINYDYAFNKFNAHSAVKPYVYSAVNAVYNLDIEKNLLLKPTKQTWFGKKIWNEHLLEVQGDGYWFNLDFLLDLQLGKDNSDLKYTYNNSRALTVNGGFGNTFSFSATVYESQGRFASYVNDYISNPSVTFKPAFSEGLVPGRGKAKGFGSDGFDYPVAEGYIAYRPNKFVQFQYGNGKNFIGDGYRSMLLSDNSSPMPYLKMSIDFWKFNYTNLWLWGVDVRSSMVVNNAHARKYMALHYLSINITDRLNIGLFEAAISKGNNGFDVGFLNPLMFYRSVEFGRGEDAGNAMVGLAGKYKIKDDIYLYSQLLIDEFSFGKLNDLSYWGNKFGMQLGFKYFDAFSIKNLYLQGELNVVRPYTFSHKDPLLNYGNYSQPLAHTWGANFWETIAIANYKFDRWTTSAKIIFGQKGFDDFLDVNNGADIYKSYTTRKSDYGNELGQGNKATIFIADFQGRYLMNASNNLSAFVGLTYRNFSPEIQNSIFKDSNNIWFTLGIKADLFNWYFDF